MTVKLVWATPDADDLVAYMARVSNPDAALGDPGAKLSQADLQIIGCYLAGYRADEAGNITAPNGRAVLGYVNKLGYRVLSVTTKCSNKRGTVLWHRFVCFCFVGTPMFSLRLVRHINSDKLDNRAFNLIPGTHAENRADVPRGVIVASGKAAGVISTERLRKLTDADVVAMRAMRRNSSAPFKVIAARFGVTAMTAHRCITGKSWKGIGQ
jgi:hypothetical protein